MTGYQIESLNVTIECNEQTMALKIVTELDLSVESDLKSLTLKANMFNISCIKELDHAEKNLAFVYNKKEILISIEKRRRPKDLRIRMEYSVTPRTGLFRQQNPNNANQFFLFTCGEGGLNSNWLPLNPSFQKKVTFKIELKVPKGYMGLSNGILANETNENSLHNSYTWVQLKPLPFHLIAIYIGPFVKHSLDTSLLPISIYLPADHTEENSILLSNALKIVSFMEDFLKIKYPWEKLDQVFIPNYHTIGALENNSIIGNNLSAAHDNKNHNYFTTPSFKEYNDIWNADTTLAHEIAHHWFGNLVTAETLDDIWIHESFATYLMFEWDRTKGEEYFQSKMLHAKKLYFNTFHSQNLRTPTRNLNYGCPAEAYDVPHTYIKGALLLYMLEDFLSKETFIKCMNAFISKHAFSYANINQVRETFESESQQDLEWFFKLINTPGHPILEIESHFDGNKQELTVKITQLQEKYSTCITLSFPITLTIYTKKETICIKKLVSEKTQKLVIATSCPTAIIVNENGACLAEIEHKKTVKELLFQTKTPYFHSQISATQELIIHNHFNPDVLQYFESTVLSNCHPTIKAEALSLSFLFGNKITNHLIRSLESKDLLIRRSAILSMGKLKSRKVVSSLKKHMGTETDPGARATTLISLSNQIKFSNTMIKTFYTQNTWHDTQKIAILEIAKNQKNSQIINTIKNLVDNPKNQNLLKTAIEAWTAIKPNDIELKNSILKLAKNGPYQLRFFAISLMSEHKHLLDEFLLKNDMDCDCDDNLNFHCKSALRELKGGEDEI